MVGKRVMAITSMKLSELNGFKAWIAGGDQGVIMRTTQKQFYKIKLQTGTAEGHTKYIEKDKLFAYFRTLE